MNVLTRWYNFDQLVFSYEAIKTRMVRAGWATGDTPRLSTVHHLLAGSCAGATTLTFTNPLWVTKTRLCLQYGGGDVSTVNVVGSNGQTVAVRYRGMLDALWQIGHKEGLRGLYRGYLPGLFGVSHGAFQFAAYEELKNFFQQRRPHARTPDGNIKLSTTEYLTCAALSKTFAVVVTYPYQVVRSRLQDQHRKYNGIVDVVKQTAKEGLRGFYKGLLPNVLRVTPACCITFVVYENVIAFMRVRR